MRLAGAPLLCQGAGLRARRSLAARRAAAAGGGRRAGGAGGGCADGSAGGGGGGGAEGGCGGGRCDGGGGSSGRPATAARRLSLRLVPLTLTSTGFPCLGAQWLHHFLASFWLPLTAAGSTSKVALRSPQSMHMRWPSQGTGRRRPPQLFTEHQGPFRERLNFSHVQR